jgi:hypothetical protein
MENHHFSWENPLFLWPFSMSQTLPGRVRVAVPVLSLALLVGCLGSWDASALHFQTDIQNEEEGISRMKTHHLILRESHFLYLSFYHSVSSQ